MTRRGMKPPSCSDPDSRGREEEFLGKLSGIVAAYKGEVLRPTTGESQARLHHSRRINAFYHLPPLHREPRRRRRG